MINEYYGAPTTPTSDFLAHYGVRGMKWGVRKALASGGSRGERRLGRQFAKASKKLAKLEKRASSGKTYAKRAAKLAAGAAAAGGLAAVGTRGVWNGMAAAGRGVTAASKALGQGAIAVGKRMTRSKNMVVKSAGAKLAAAGLGVKHQHAKTVGDAIKTAGKEVGKWGSKNTIGAAANKVLTSDKLQNLGRSYHGAGGQAVRNAGSKVAQGASAAGKVAKSLSNNTIARIGAAGVAAGLGAAAARNAYKAATTKRAAKKAARFRSEMNRAFAGTKYANSNPTPKKRRRK